MQMEMKEKAGAAILIFDKIDIKTKAIRNKRHYII